MSGSPQTSPKPHQTPTAYLPTKRVPVPGLLYQVVAVGLDVPHGGKARQPLLIDKDLQGVAGGDQDINTHVKLKAIEEEGLQREDERLRVEDPQPGFLPSVTTAGPQAPGPTLVIYCWQIMCSPCFISLGFRVMKMPRPWQPLSGLQMYVLFFLIRP